MKFSSFLAGMLAFASVGMAQIVTVHSKVTGSSGSLSDITLGSAVVAEYTITSPASSVGTPPPGIHVWSYDARVTLSAEGHSAFLTDAPTQFYVQDAPGFWGIIASSPGFSLELWSSDPSVLSADHLFLTNVPDASVFDRINGGGFTLPDQSGQLVLSGQSVEVRSLTPVPEPSTFGLLGAAALLGCVALRAHRKRKA